MSILGSTCRGYPVNSGHAWHSPTSSAFQPSHNHAHTKPQANHNGTRQLTKCKSYLTGTSTHQLGLHRSMCVCTCKINACFAMPVRFTDYLFLQKTNPHIGEEPSFFLSLSFHVTRTWLMLKTWSFSFLLLFFCYDIFLAYPSSSCLASSRLIRTVSCWPPMLPLIW